MVNMLILEILRNETDAEHSITQQEILRRLGADYDLDCDRRTVGNNISYLQEMGYDIDTEHGYRLMSREFDDTELRMLIDSVLFSRMIPERQARDLIGRLKELSSRHFQAKVSHITGMPEMPRSANKEILYNLDVINDAIDEGRKIRYDSNHYGTDLRMHKSASSPRTVSPYRTVANNGKYYLICWDDYFQDICYFRIDRMTNMQILDEPGKPLRSIPGYEHGIDLPRQMAEHVYMYRGEGIPIKIRTTTGYIDDLVDWFGRDIRIQRQDGDEIIVRLKCNEQSMFYWAMQYGVVVEVLEPQSLRGRIKDALQEMTQRYNHS